MAQTIADIFDSYFRWLVLFLMLIAIKHGMHAAAYLVGPDAAEALRAWAHWPGRAGIGAVLIGLGLYGRAAWRSKTVCVGSLFKQGYVYEMLRRSALFSFVLAGVTVLLLIELMSNADVPADFAFNLVAALLGATFSVSFFVRDLGEMIAGAEQESTA